MSRKDVIKSLLRSAVNSTGEQLRRIRLPDEVRQALLDAVKMRISVKDQRLTAAAARVAGISEVTVAVGEGSIRIDALLKDDRCLALTLTPLGAAFAPRGAKELSFGVKPTDAAGDPSAPELVGAIAAEIARAVWGPFLPRGSRDPYCVFVERDDQLLRVDLRTVPELRAALRRQSTALLIELLDIKDIEAEPGALRITLGIQGLDR